MPAMTQPRWLGRALSHRHGPVDHTVPDLIVSEEWIAEISGAREPVPDGPAFYGVAGDEPWEA
jgi:hypothetical protein